MIGKMHSIALLKNMLAKMTMYMRLLSEQSMQKKKLSTWMIKSIMKSARKYTKYPNVWKACLCVPGKIASKQKNSNSKVWEMP